MGRRIWASGAVAAAVFSFLGWWFFVANRLEAAAEQQIARWQAQGVTVEFASRTSVGFPFRVGLRYEAPSLSGRTSVLAFTWRGPEELVASTPIWSPRSIQVLGSGLHHIELAGPAGQLRAEAEDTEALLTSTPEAWRGEVRVRTLKLKSADGLALARAPGAWLRIQVGERAAVASTLSFPTVELAEPGPLGPLLEDVAASITLSRVPAGNGPTALESWRQSGGRLFIEQAAMTWGPTAITARGALGLDRELRPAGEISATVRGYEPAIDMLIATGRIPRDNGPALKLLGRFMALGSGGKAVELPLKLDGGWLYAGPARLSPLPSLGEEVR